MNNPELQAAAREIALIAVMDYSRGIFSSDEKIKEETLQEATAAIVALVEQREREARIEELKRAVTHQWAYGDEKDAKWLTDRLAALQPKEKPDDK